MRIEMNQSGNSWLEFVQFFHQNNPKLSYKQALQEASGPYKKMKKQYQQKRGGNYPPKGVDLDNEQMRFKAGVSALNSNLANIGRRVIFGGNYLSGCNLNSEQMRFEAGVSALNCNLKEIGRPIMCGAGKSRSSNPQDKSRSVPEELRATLNGKSSSKK